MVFILATVFSKSNYLRGSGLTSDIKAGHSNCGSSSTAVHYVPHSFNHSVMNIFIDRQHFWIGAIWIQRLETSTRFVVCGSWSTNRTHFLKEVRNVHFATHAHSRDGSDQRDRRDDVVHLTKRCIDSINVAPVRILWLHSLLEFARRGPADDF